MPNTPGPKMPASTLPPKAGATPTVVGVKVTLRGSEPKIWRRIAVKASMTFGGLHDAIQAAMGWTDSHMHAFTIGGTQYGARDVEMEMSDESKMTLAELIKSGVNRFTYTYDFGDNWEHVVLLEKAVPKTGDMTLPACVAGERRCPPEDCGGLWGYEELLQILADPKHPEYKERREWIGEALDPEAFDIVAANAALRQAFAHPGRRGIWVRR